MSVQLCHFSALMISKKIQFCQIRCYMTLLAKLLPNCQSSKFFSTQNSQNRGDIDGFLHRRCCSPVQTGFRANLSTGSSAALQPTYKHVMYLFRNPKYIESMRSRILHYSKFSLERRLSHSINRDLWFDPILVVIQILIIKTFQLIF